MTVATPKKQKKTGKRAAEPRKQETGPTEAVFCALRSHFKHITGNLRIRHLWSDSDVHRFRLNWWEESSIMVENGIMGGSSILTSCFVKVIDDDGSLTIGEEK